MSFSQSAGSPPTARSAPSLGLVAIGGGIGSLARHGAVSTELVGPTVSVFVLNVAGSLLLGALGAWWRRSPIHGAESRPVLDTTGWTALLGTGFCGGLTTFSTHMVDVAGRLDTAPFHAAWSLAATAATAVAAAASGFTLMDRRMAQMGDRS